MTSADLTIDDIRLAYESVTPPLWVRRIQEAEDVVVRPSSIVDGQTALILDLRESLFMAPEDRLMIVCAPDHVEAVRAAVRGLRGQR